jgi:hypothetical protein
VPKPAITTLTPALSVKKSGKRSATKQRGELRSNARRLATLWKKNVPTFRIQGIFLSELDKRTKNDKQDIAALNKVIERMTDIPADACSGIWQDEEGQTLLAAFAHQGWQRKSISVTTLILLDKTLQKIFDIKKAPASCFLFTSE